MAKNSNQGPQSDPVESYGGYGGYQPANPVDDPYGANQGVAFNRAIQTMCMGNTSRLVVISNSSSIRMSPLRVYSEDRRKEVLDHPLPSYRQLVRVQPRKRTASLLFIVTSASALGYRFFLS